MSEPQSTSSARSGEDLARLLERGAAAVATRAGAISSRRGMIAVAVGALIVALAWIGERDSAWGFPMLLAGTTLIALGLIGPRLSGSLSLRWGEDGAFFQLTSTIAPPGQRGGASARPSGTDSADELPPQLVPPTEIEGSAETMEINVEALKGALEGEGGQPQPLADPGAATLPTAE